MATLHVRNVPDRLHQRIRKLAADEGLSLSAEVLALLDGAAHDREMRRRQGRVLEQIRRRRYRAPKGASNTLALLREDRRR